MRGNPIRRAAKTPRESSLAALARAASEAHEVVERDLWAKIATPEALAQRYQTAIDNISQGVCFFDGESRLILCNRRYAEIYRLAPEQVRPGATLREIVEARVGAGTSAVAGDAYLLLLEKITSSRDSGTLDSELKDGRTIHIGYQPMPDGGWVTTYEDITELKATRAVANERLSLQALIDCLPDSLWVKDVNSRFVIANKTTAKHIGVAGPADLIG
ncbi:MAG: PAS-domain containing protein, partial [Roseiarcus sp.]